MRALLATVAVLTTSTTVSQIITDLDIDNLQQQQQQQQQRRSLLLSRHSNNQFKHKGYEKQQRRLNKESNISSTAAAPAGEGSNNNDNNNKTGVKRTSRHAGTNGEGITRGGRRGGRDKERDEVSNVEEEKGTPKRGENKEDSDITEAAEELIKDEKIILKSLSSEQVVQSSSTQEEEESTNKLEQYSNSIKLPNIAGGIYNAGISVTDRIKKIYSGNKDDKDGGSGKVNNEIPYDNPSGKSSWNSPKTEMPSTPEPTSSTTDTPTPTTYEPTRKGDDWKTPSPTKWNNNDDNDWTKGSTKSKHSSDSKSKKTSPKKSSSSWGSWDDSTPPPTPWGSSSWDDDNPSWGDDEDMWSKSNKSHKTHKTNKSSTKERTLSVCTKRLHTAYTQMSEFSDPKGPFGEITKRLDVTNLCAFSPPTNIEHINYGCPFIYDPNNPKVDEPTGYGFVEGLKEYQMYWKEELAGQASEKDIEKFATAYNSFAQYCQCYQGYDMECATRIPPTQETMYSTTSEERVEFCKLGGVWNGDFSTDVVQDFTEDMKECGCYWIGVAKDMVGTCPGVELGAWYKFHTPAPGPRPSPTVAPTSSPTSDETIAELVDDDDDLKTLYAALEAADLVDVLSSSGPFTLFAPTDEAFDKLPDGALDSLLKTENKETLTSLLFYHVSTFPIFGTDLSNGQDIETINGKEVHVTISSDGIMINKAEVIDPDILARNGIIHKIDQVLIPPDITLVDSFEPVVTEFPDGLWLWNVEEFMGTSFTRTDTQAYDGDWSVVTPDICDGSAPSGGNLEYRYMTLKIDSDWGPGKLTYYVNSKDLKYPADVLVLEVNDEDTFTQGWTGNSTNDGPDDWNKYTLDLQNGRSTGPQSIMSSSTKVDSLTWYYICKPAEYNGTDPGGRAYIDYITFTPSDEDMEMIDISPPSYWTFPDS